MALSTQVRSYRALKVIIYFEKLHFTTKFRTELFKFSKKELVSRTRIHCSKKANGTYSQNYA